MIFKIPKYVNLKSLLSVLILYSCLIKQFYLF